MSDELFKDEIAVRLAWDKRNRQDLFQLIKSLVNQNQATKIEKFLVPDPSKEEEREELRAVKKALKKHGLDTSEVDAKIEILSAPGSE